MQRLTWSDGLAPDGSRLLIPRCGISYRDIIAAAEMCATIPAASVRLGVGETTLRTCVETYRLQHWFSPRDAPKCPTKLTRRRLLYWLRQGMTRQDIAKEIGVSYAHLNVMIRRHQIGTLNRGAASWLARRGIAEQIPNEEGAH